MKETVMLDTVQVCFPGNPKRYTYLTRTPALIGDYAVVDSPISGLISLPIVDVGIISYAGATKYVERIITAPAALSSTKTPAPVNWKTEKFTLLHESGALLAGQRWHDTEKSAVDLAREIIRENHDNQRRNGKIVVLKAVAVMGLEDPTIEIKRFAAKRVAKKRSKK